MLLDVSFIILLSIIWPSWNGGSISLINCEKSGHHYLKYSFPLPFSFPPCINFMDGIFLGVIFSRALEVSSDIFFSSVVLSSSISSLPLSLPRHSSILLSGLSLWKLPPSLPPSLVFLSFWFSRLFPVYTPTSCLLFSVSALSTLVVRIVFSSCCNDFKTYTVHVLASDVYYVFSIFFDL